MIKSIIEHIQIEPKLFANVTEVNSRFVVADSLLIDDSYGLRALYYTENGVLYTCGAFDMRNGLDAALRTRIRWLAREINCTPNHRRAINYNTLRSIHVSNKPRKKRLKHELNACLTLLNAI